MSSCRPCVTLEPPRIHCREYIQLCLDAYLMSHRRKTLLPVIFTYPTPSKPTCPSCTKELSNSTSAVLLSSRTPISSAEPQNGETDSGHRKKKAKKDKEDPYVCGHIVCQMCSDTIVKPAGRCPVCEAKVNDAGRISLGKEGESRQSSHRSQRLTDLSGTGFAAAGGAEVKKSTIAFRV